MSKDNFIKIASSSSTIEAEQIIQILKANGISAYRQGGIMDLYMGNSTVGEAIMVSAKDQIPAQKIVNEFQPIKTNTTVYGHRFSRWQLIIGWALLTLMILCIVVPLIFL